MQEVVSRFGLSQRRICRLTGWNRSSLQYQCLPSRDVALRHRLRHWAALKPRWGAPILHDILKSEGLVINHKRTERIYREEGLSLRHKRRKKLPAVARVPLATAERPNQHWFRSIPEARLLIEHWRSHDSNRIRPHSSIGRIPPDSFALISVKKPTINPHNLNSASAYIPGRSSIVKSHF